MEYNLPTVYQLYELRSQSQSVLAVLSGGEGNAVNSGDAASVEDNECEDPGFMYPALVIVQAARAAVKEQTSRLKDSDNKQSKTKKTNSKVNNVEESNVVEINLEQSKVDEMQISKVKRSNLNESNVVQSIVDLSINVI